jgi:DNA processing protein
MEVRMIELGGPEYPPLLCEGPDAPARLYAAGRVLEPAPMVSVVGSRRASRYGVEVAAWLARSLAASGLTMVSGMALGIDAAAHRGAIEGGGTTVAVLGCGLDVRYPLANAGLRASILEHGTLLSEYPAGVRPVPWHFPVRNRIIAGMSLATVVVEARPGGGALITARLAAEMGREVFAVPGPVHAPGSGGVHALVRDGARLVTCAVDVLQDLGFGELAMPLPNAADPGGGRDAPGPDRVGSRDEVGTDRVGDAPGPDRAGSRDAAGAGGSGDESRLLATLEAEPLLLDAVAARAGLPVSATAALLARLELRGRVVRHPGARFSRAISG